MTRSPDDDPSPRLTSERERRAAARYPCRRRAILRHADTSVRGQAVVLYDVSTAGVSFTSDELVKIGESAELDIAGLPPSEVTVVWAVFSDTTQTWRIGCRWAVPLGEPTVAKLVDRPAG
jgi:hypothetical protein